MAVPIVGIGDSFEFASVSSPATFTTLAGVYSVDFGGDKVATEKTTTMATVNGVDTFIGSTQNPGTVDVKAFYEPGDVTQIALETIKNVAAPVEMKVTYGNSNSRTFLGIVESFTPKFPLDKPATVDIKIQISGPIAVV